MNPVVYGQEATTVDTSLWRGGPLSEPSGIRREGDTSRRITTMGTLGSTPNWMPWYLDRRRHYGFVTMRGGTAKWVLGVWTGDRMQQKANMSLWRRKPLSESLSDRIEGDTLRTRPFWWRTAPWRLNYRPYVKGLKRGLRSSEILCNERFAARPMDNVHCTINFAITSQSYLSVSLPVWILKLITCVIFLLSNLVLLLLTVECCMCVQYYCVGAN